MAVIFDRNSAKITTDFTRTKPNCFLTDSQRVHFHLTEGFRDDRLCKRGHGPALTATGSIRVSATKAELAGWDFGFIQVARANFMSTFYLGRTPKEGSLDIQTHFPPALPNSLLLDATSAAKPWMRFSDAYETPMSDPPLLTTDMSDHPHSCAPKVRFNDKTNRENLLFHHVTEYELWSTLCAKDPRGNFQQFAHFRWVVHYDETFIWHGRQMMKKLSKSFITQDKPVLGPPTDAAILALINPPVDPVANHEFDWANNNLQKVAPNYIAYPDWFPNVPADFFTP